METRTFKLQNDDVRFSIVVEVLVAKQRLSADALFGSIIESVSHSIFHNWSLVELDCLEDYDITEKLGLNPEVCKIRLTDCDLYRNYEWKEFSIVAQSP